jgi:hypothetical protein
MLSALRGTFSVSLAEDPLNRLKRLVKEADRFLPAGPFRIPRPPVSSPVALTFAFAIAFAADGGVSTSTSFRAASASGEMVVAGESGPEDTTGICGTRGLGGVGWRSSMGMGRGWVGKDGDGDREGSMVGSCSFHKTRKASSTGYWSVCGVFSSWQSYGCR